MERGTNLTDAIKELLLHYRDKLTQYIEWEPFLVSAVIRSSLPSIFTCARNVVNWIIVDIIN